MLGLPEIPIPAFFAFLRTLADRILGTAQVAPTGLLSGYPFPVVSEKQRLSFLLVEMKIEFF